ncbi:DUF455 family protein [Cohnella laeviribosi]|uniref:DUF455 family protein n=1 Tax=Cohnella laeviribosi TaxID=380174 RepID=UPI000365D0A6|nr:DUF455 family protein [Cohnella laeviribosi]
MEESVVLAEVAEKMFNSDIKRKSPYLRPTDTGEMLKTLFWQEFELSRIAFGWVPAVPKYESKLKLGRFGYLHNRNAKFLEARINELPVTLNKNESAVALTREAFERMTLAENDQHFFASYFFILQRLYEQYDNLMDRLDPVLDAPTVDQLNLVFVERNRMLNWVREQIRFYNVNVTDAENAKKAQAWGEYVAVIWHLFMQGLQEKKSVDESAWPAHPVEQPAGPVPADSAWEPNVFPLYEGPMPSEEELENNGQSFAGALQKGKNFSDPLMSPFFESVKQMIYIHSTEIGPAEVLCYVYYCTHDMPFEFYYDLARHAWDEFRHTEMGVRRIKQLGYSTTDFKYFKGSPGKEISDEWVRNAYTGLTMIAEPCSFTKKRKSAEAFWEFGDALSAIQTEFDIADERTHVNFGQKWGTELYKKIGQVYTAKELAEKVRIQRLNGLGVTVDDFKKVVKNFPMFCGFSTTDLNYGNY